MAKRSELIRKMHDEGMTFEQIGRVFGISRQAAHEAMYCVGDRFQLSKVEMVKYVGLREWMIKNRVSFSKLNKLCGVTTIRNSLLGSFDLRKKTIDAILTVTGMTYEECFKEDDLSDDV